MAGQERRRSRGELIRERAQGEFVGRREQLSLFSENLAKDPLSESDPADFLFSVHGLGGVGKSTLLRQWREAARRAGALTAVVDENDVHGVPQTLTELARQLAGEGGTLKGFDKAVEQFEQLEREQAAAGPDPAGGDGAASLSSRVAAQATLGALSMVPAVGAVTAMASSDAAAQALDRLRESARSRVRRGRSADAAGLFRAFVTELERLCGQYRWVVLFFDTWEQTGRHLDAWVRELVQDGFGPLPVNVMVVLAGRDELSERDWAPLRPLVNDLRLDVFTEVETRALLAARGVSEPAAVDAVFQLSLGLPLLVELLALTPPADDAPTVLEHRGDAVDAVVKRFVQWITDPVQQRTVLACALAPQLNEDVFAAAAPQEGRHLWEWLNAQPFVSGHGDFKQYHAVVRASMLRQQRLDSPQRWASAHLRLAEAQAAWRAEVEARVMVDHRWKDARWRRLRLVEEYHRMCADPVAGLEGALGLTVDAAGRTAPYLREWTDLWEQAARDTDDAALAAWAARLREAAAAGEPELAVLTAVLTHGRPSAELAALARAHRGRHLYFADRDDEALAEVERALAVVPGQRHALATRGAVHTWHHRTDRAIADLTASLAIERTYWTLTYRGEAHRRAGHHDAAVADFTEAVEMDPGDGWALSWRGEAYRGAGRLDEAVADFTAALDLDPADASLRTSRGWAHRDAERYDEAVADFTAALDLTPDDPWVLASRGWAHRGAGRHDEAVADLTAAIALDPDDAWMYASRGWAHRDAERYEETVADMTAALERDPGDAAFLGSRGEAHRQAGRLDASLRDLDAAITLDPAYAWGLAERGATHRAALRYEDAIADCTAALAIDPAFVWALAERGAAHQLAGHDDAAIADFTAVLAVDPRYVWAFAMRGVTHRLFGRHDEAVADLTAALALYPAYAWALEERGRAHRQADRYDEAVADFDAAHALAPDDAEVLAARGFTHRLAGRLDDAVRDLTAALDLDPAYTWALAMRGSAHQRAGRYDEAVADCTAALALDSTYTWPRSLRAETHRLAGRFDDAAQDFDACLALDPRDAWALASRGQVRHEQGRSEEALADLTAAIEIEPSGWMYQERARYLRQAGAFERAREDVERARAADGTDPELTFEELLLDTWVHGYAACAERWRELLVESARTADDWEPDPDTEALFGLFRAVLLEPGTAVEEAVAAFRAAGLRRETVMVTGECLDEIARADPDGAQAARARAACRSLRESAPPPGSASPGSAPPVPPPSAD